MLAQLRSFSFLSPSRSSPMGVTRKHECRSLEKMMPSLMVLRRRCGVLMLPECQINARCVMQPSLSSAAPGYMHIRMHAWQLSSAQCAQRYGVGSRC